MLQARDTDGGTALMLSLHAGDVGVFNAVATLLRKFLTEKQVTIIWFALYCKCHLGCLSLPGCPPCLFRIVVIFKLTVSSCMRRIRGV